MHPRLIAVLVAIVVSIPVRGQFYAPETEYHDVTQRVFPVEAARVLAWHRAASGQPAVAEVTYQVSTSPSQETVWKIQWLDAAKKPVREREIRYAAEQLIGGPDFYRGVFEQVQGDDWRIGAASPDNAATTFWQGAELSGTTRLDAIKAASTLLSEKPKMARAADAARMAGILTHATLPRFRRQASIDAVLVSRAAAWLCVAEARSREKFDASWVSILFLSGREKAAGQLSTTAIWRSEEKLGVAERFWKTLSARPSAKEMFAFAGKPENKTFALPMISYAASLDDSLERTAAEVADDLVGATTLDRLSEYSPTGVKRGTTAETVAGASSELTVFLTRWEQSLAEFRPTEGDYSEYTEVAAKLPAKGPSDLQVTALQRLSPLLNLGVDQGIGPLVPTAHATMRDLLGYGWEMGCSLSSAYDDALVQSNASPETRKAFTAVVLDSVKGSNLFMGAPNARAGMAIDSPLRIQFVGSSRAQRAVLRELLANWAPDKFLRRQWLNRVATRAWIAHLVEAKASDDVIKEMVERVIREGGPSIAQNLSWKEPSYAAALDRLGLRESINLEVPAIEEIDPETFKLGLKSRVAGSADTPSTSTETAESVDFSKFKTAAEFWTALEKLRDIPKRAANSPEDRLRQIRAWLDTRRSAAEAFLKAYPNDPHRHSAKLMMIDSMLQLERFGDQSIAKLDGNDLEVIISAADADDVTKGEAAFFKLMVDSRQVHYSSPHTLPPFQQALANYLEKYPKHERAQYVAAMLGQTLSTVETPSTEPLLKKLVKNPNEQIAAQAKTILQRRQFMLELKKKPLDLKFTAFDGKEVDASRLRGKVVLLDFWASWCGPCMSEAPHVVATYQKLRERGFEIIGISLDEDKAAMESALKSANMTWPQYFDGKGWKSEVAQRFGINSIPATWLFDKQGKLREHGLRGKELEARIENLLKEK